MANKLLQLSTKADSGKDGQLMGERFPDIMQAFSHIAPFNGPWEPHAGKSYELEMATRAIDGLKEYTAKVREIVRHKPGLKVASNFRTEKKDVVQKNICWLTSISLLKLSPMRFTIDQDDPETYQEISGKVDRIRKQIEPFNELYELGIIIPIPTLIDEYDGIFDRSSETDLSSDVLDVGFNNQFIIEQITEHSIANPPNQIIELLLPRVASIPLPEIYRLRKEYGSIFLRFQGKLFEFISKSAAIDSERKFMDLLFMINEQIEILRTEFEKIDHKKRLEKMGLIYSFGVMALIPLLPSDVFRSIAALMGTSNILHTIRNIRLLDIERRAFEDTPFYLPYRLTELEKQYGK